MTDTGTGTGEGVDPGLVHAWLAGRSLARGLPQPAADHGGWRVDVNSDTEISRWVFAAPCAGIAAVARERAAQGYRIKLCGTKAALAALVAPEWAVERTGCFMIGGSVPEDRPLPPGYERRIARDGHRTEVRILARDGTDAARGIAAETAGGFTYDRIVTEPGHRRRGLGRAIVTGLAHAKRNRAVPDLLVATDMGRALYESLGWRVLSPYATALLPGSAR